MTNVIILAAGLGSRLSPLTDDKPKSLITFGKETLLERNINMFKKNGINDISIITGYKKNKINFPKINYFKNKNYTNNSTLERLFYAKEKILDSTIITYSDIIFEEEVLKKLLKTKNDISVVVDKKWKKYWSLRIGESISEATETAEFDDQNLIKSIGMKNPDANGHFIGLMKLENEGSKKFKELFLKIKNDVKDGKNDLNENLLFEKLRIVDLLSGLIKKNIQVNSILIDNGWLEFDTINDYELYSNMLNENTISELIKLNY